MNRFLLLLLVFVPFLSIAQKFTDITKKAGIEHQFVVYEGMFGGGACVFDINNDGWEDVFITSGMNEDVLYLNNGNGTFKNIYRESGLTETAKYVTQGAAAADVNKDGWVDLFITTITLKDGSKTIPRAENLLFLNKGDMTFRNVTKEFKIDQLMSFSTGVSFGDFDQDGYPDAYIGNYFHNYEGTLSAINDETIVNSTQTTQGYLLRNMNGTYFNNMYSEYQLKHKGFGFGGIFTDFDNDLDLDLFVHHDFGYKATPDLLLQNQYPEDYFKDISEESQMDLKINSMGTAIGDYNNDGLLDYYITNIRFNQFMVNEGIGKPFVEKSKETGLVQVSISWGTNFADFDHDTDLDLFVANGDLNPNDVPMADFYFENENAQFTEKAWMLGLNDYAVGRGSVVFDMDNDGDIDLLVVNQKPVLDFPLTSMTKLYRNDSTRGNWLKVKLQGTSSDTQGIGSRVEVVTGKLKMIREIDGGSSHISQNSTIAHFGLGNAQQIDSVIVKWMGGKKQVIIQPPVNQLLVVNEVPLKSQFSLTPYLLGLLFLFIIAAAYISWRALRKG